MTNHVVRLYTLAISILVLFLAWAAIATHPWQTGTPSTTDPRVHALILRERHVRHQSVVVQRVHGLHPPKQMSTELFAAAMTHSFRALHLLPRR